LHCGKIETACNHGDADVDRSRGSDADVDRSRGISTIDSAPATLKLEVGTALLRRIAMLFDGGFTFTNFLADVLAVFLFVVWFWLLIIVFGDLFRRRDISGWAKALWVIGLLVFPYLGVFVYMISQGTGMAERARQQAQQTREELRQVVGFSAADEIEKLGRLKQSGSITNEEFTRLRAKLVA